HRAGPPRPVFPTGQTRIARRFPQGSAAAGATRGHGGGASRNTVPRREPRRYSTRKTSTAPRPQQEKNTDSAPAPRREKRTRAEHPGPSPQSERHRGRKSCAAKSQIDRLRDRCCPRGNGGSWHADDLVKRGWKSPAGDWVKRAWKKNHKMTHHGH